MPFAVTNQTIGAAGTLEDSFVAPSASRPNDFTPLNPSVVNVVNVAIAPPAPTTGTLATTIEYAQGIVSESVAEYGVQETPVVITLLATLEDAALLAEYLIRSAPAFWFGNIQVIMNGLTDAQRTTINSLDIGSQVSVTKTFPNSTPSTVTQLMALEGISHDITPDRHIVTLYPNPARIYTYFIVGGYPVVATRTNLITNPSFETNTTIWDAGAGVTLARSTAATYSGTASGLITLTNTVANSGINNLSNRSAATAGLSYTASTYAQLNTGTAFTYSVVLFFYDAGGSILSTAASTATTLGSSWERKTVTATAPANTVTVGMQIRRNTALTGTASFYVDAIMIEQTASALPYFDGTYVDNYTGYGLNSKAWNGTANASTSTATWYQGATRTNLITNPNFETNIDNWNVADVSLARVTTDAYLGTASMSMTPTTLSTLARVGQNANWAATAGVTYTGTAYMRNTAGNDRNMVVSLRFADVASGITGETFGTVQATTVGGGWTRFTVTATAPALTASADLLLYPQYSNPSLSNVAFVDAVLVEQGSSVLPYFDGTYADTYTGYTLQSQSWSGTANASTSTGIWGLTSAFVGSQLDDDTKGLG